MEKTSARDDCENSEPQLFSNKVVDPVIQWRLLLSLRERPISHDHGWVTTYKVTRTEIMKARSATKFPDFMCHHCSTWPNIMTWSTGKLWSWRSLLLRSNWKATIWRTWSGLKFYQVSTMDTSLVTHSRLKDVWCYSYWTSVAVCGKTPHHGFIRVCVASPKLVYKRDYNFLINHTCIIPTPFLA